MMALPTCLGHDPEPHINLHYLVFTEVLILLYSKIQFVVCNSDKNSLCLYMYVCVCVVFTCMNVCVYVCVCVCNY